MRTSIAIAGLQSYAHHGLFEEERSLGQKFCFDVHAELGHSATHRDDNLESSIRYDDVIAKVVTIAETSIFQTLEALAEAIARGLLEHFTRMESVSVRVSKLSPPIRETLQRAGVEVQLSRSELADGRSYG
jgi:dihydroneopterin aldolase